MVFRGEMRKAYIQAQEVGKLPEVEGCTFELQGPLSLPDREHRTQKILSGFII